MSVVARVPESEVSSFLAAEERRQIERKQQLKQRAEDELSVARVSADPHGLVAQKVARAEKLIREGHYERAIHVLRSGVGC